MSIANNHKWKMLFSLIILFSVMPTFSYAEQQLPEAPIFIDNEPVKTKYMLREGHLHVPALFFKNMGAYVDWNNDYQSVVFRLKDTMFALPVGKKYYDDFDRKLNKWERHSLPVETIMVDGKPFVPLVNVAEQLGMEVRYDTKSRSTFVTTNYFVKPNMFLRGNQKEKLVALTFDDGPENHYTPIILDILKEKGVRATFFAMGKQVRKHPAMMKRIVAEGHAIGNHSYNHPDLRKVWSSKVINEIQSTQAEFMRVTGRTPDIIRPPYGALTKADTAILNELGLRNILWSVDTVDWKGVSADEIVETVQNTIHPGGVILQHNFESTTGALDGSVEALPKIIDDLRGKGYKFVTVQTMLAAQK
ncbi:polysaccharide deacetylase family protein [bacterium LRH843]|nr:polysaccharide deacetylase family protein [bacterium LRH843]